MNKGLIAIIDDDELDRFIYRKIILLTCPSFQIIDFSDGIEALEYLSRHSKNSSKLPDLVLLDLRMPGINGLEYLMKYAEIKPGLTKHSRHFICTSSMERVGATEAVDDLYGYYMKPISPKDIFKMVSDTVGDLESQNKT